MDKTKIIEALGTVEDPDFKKDLVTLQMIDDLEIEGNKVGFKIVLTTPACPLKDELENNSIAAIKKIYPEAAVEVEFTSRVTSRREDKELLPNVKNIIAVASGKGGVGKSTIAVNLALGLARNNAKVGLMDADIYGPSIPVMMGVKGARPNVKEVDGKHIIEPIEKFGVKLLSIGFLVDELQAVVWRGPMASSALRQFVTDCDWGELDYLVIDLPPGTGDIHLTLVQTVPVTGAVIVTTPQEVAMADAKKAIGMFKMGQINVPVLGLVENMSYFTPKELPENKYYIFGKNGGKDLARKFDIPVLGEIPLVQGIREAGDQGKPALIDEKDTITSDAFDQLAQNVAQQVSIRNADAEPTKRVKIST